MNTPEPQDATAAPPSAPAPVHPQPAPQAAPAPASTGVPATPPPATPKTDQPQSRDPLLTASIDDAYVLLDFSCRQGNAPADQLSDTLINSRQKQESDTPLTANEEAAFWDAFAQITKLVSPVTVESIRFTSPPHPSEPAFKKSSFWSRVFKPVGPAERVLRHYLTAAAVTLLLLLALQVEWAIGSFIYNDAFRVHHNQIQGKRELIAAQQTNENVKGTPAAPQAEFQLTQARDDALLDQSWNDVSYVRLWWWNREVAAYIPPFDLVISSKNGVMTDNLANDSGVTLDAYGRQRLEYTRTELTLQVMANYFLVTLFALMGALTQALRAISRQIQEVSLIANDLYRVRTRVILGVISGVCMAWLYIISTTTANAPPDNRTPLDAISYLGAFTPWAIAFISGYSVEIFFALLERVIAIVTAKIKGLDAQPSPPAPAKISIEPADTKNAPAPKSA